MFLLISSQVPAKDTVSLSRTKAAAVPDVPADSDTCTGALGNAKKKNVHQNLEAARRTSTLVSFSVWISSEKRQRSSEKARG